MSHILAREHWSGLSADARKTLLAALDADEKLHDHDFAGLPPQVHAGIIAALQPDDPEPEPETRSRGGRRKDD